MNIPHWIKRTPDDVREVMEVLDSGRCNECGYIVTPVTTSSTLQLVCTNESCSHVYEIEGIEDD